MDVHDQIDLTSEAFLIKLIFLSRRGLQSPLDIQTLEHSSFATRFERVWSDFRPENTMSCSDHACQVGFCRRWCPERLVSMFRNVETP